MQLIPAPPTVRRQMKQDPVAWSDFSVVAAIAVLVGADAGPGSYRKSSVSGLATRP